MENIFYQKSNSSLSSLDDSGRDDTNNVASDRQQTTQMEILENMEAEHNVANDVEVKSSRRIKGRMHHKIWIVGMEKSAT